MEAAVWGEHAAERPICGWVEVDGQALGRFRLGNDGWKVLWFPLPPDVARPVAQGRIVTERTWVPRDVGLGEDTRQLGIAVRRIWVV